MKKRYFFNIINIFIIETFLVVSCSDYSFITSNIVSGLISYAYNDIINDDESNNFNNASYTPNSVGNSSLETTNQETATVEPSTSSKRRILPPPLLPNTPYKSSTFSNEIKDVVITHEHICFALATLEKNYSSLPNFSRSNLGNLQEARKYFCNDGAKALKRLADISYQGSGNKKDVFVDKVFESNSNTGSLLATATASKEANVKLDVYPYISSGYCDGLEIYKSRYGASNVKEIDFIKILKSSVFSSDVFHSKWCSFHIKSKPILFVLTPEYKGVLIQNMFFNNKLFIELNYLTESINLVKDFLAVSIAYNNPDGSLSTYSYRFMASIKTAFHDALVKSSIDKAKDIAIKRFELNKKLNNNF